MKCESCFRGALSALFFAMMIGSAPQTAWGGQETAPQPQRLGALGADRENVSRRPETPGVPEALVVEKLYAAAVADGFEESQIAEAALVALADRISGHQLQRIYANAVLSNVIPLSMVRQSLRELGHRREVWEEWPREKANIIYALSIVSGGEPDSMVRERLRTALDSLSERDLGESPPHEGTIEPASEERNEQGLEAVRQPFCDADCGPEDPEHPFNIYETDMYREWVLWHEWFHGGPCPNCWTLIDAERIEALITEACEISDELSLVADVQTLYEIIVTRPDSAVAKYWIRRLTSWAAKAGRRFALSQVSGVGAAANAVSAACWIRRMVDEAN